MPKNYTDINSAAIDQWVRDGWEWGQEISHETYLRAKQGDWSVLLTPTKPVPKEWFCPMQGAKILGLASGGGQQIPIFTALGAQCTVLDYSQEQLRKEELVARREGYDVELVRADMSKPLPFADESFDLIFHPVSNCYVKELQPIWNECYRVLKKGGMLVTATGFVNRETLEALPQNVQDVLLRERPDIFDDLYEDTVLAGFGKIDTVIDGCWYTDDDDSTIADLARSLGMNLKFTSYTRFCYKL